MTEDIILCKEIKNKPKKYCIFEDCKKHPNYNFNGETKPLYYCNHKKENMINVKNKTCIFKGCKTQPSYNIEGKKKPLYCLIHKQAKYARCYKLQVYISRM